jgi:Pyruvate/2-oxoacid:ferredoxin oxidoreductase delta subunit
MRTQLSDIPLAIQRQQPEIETNTFRIHAKNPFFQDTKCLVCENCFLILKDVNTLRDDDIKALAYQGKVKFKLVSINYLSF